MFLSLHLIHKELNVYNFQYLFVHFNSVYMYKVNLKDHVIKQNYSSRSKQKCN